MITKLDIPLSETEFIEKILPIEVENFFEAGAIKKFLIFSNYSDNFFNESQEEITNSTFMVENM